MGGPEWAKIRCLQGTDIDECWVSMKAGELFGLSKGYKVFEFESGSLLLI
jgi:hypothetical protein